ncbi:MAG: hypothetical protein RLN88_12855 [Ekhidna sp.]|uniref:hypothetical protein n=1 Tax=Ekhidna sp. TaxID=2608089 RepID=UPI0032ECD75D
MKKLFVLMFLTTILKFCCNAQVLTGEAYVQNTVMGLQKGYGLRIQTNKGLGIGLVHQSNLNVKGESLDEKYPFYGIETIVPLTRCGNMRLFFTPKAGFVNEHFFVIIPEVETEIRISDTFSTALTAGIRARESAVGVKLMVHL